MKKLIYVVLSLMLLSMLTLSTTAAESKSNETAIANKTLATAYEIRSKNPPRFRQLLEQLNQKKQQLTPKQQAELDYLNSYNAAFTGKIDTAIAILETLLQNDAADYELKFDARILLINAAGVSENWAAGLKEITPIITELSNIENNELYNKAIGVLAIFFNVLGQHERALHFVSLHRKTKFGSRDDCTISSSKIEATLRLNRLDNELLTNGFESCEAAGELILKSSIHVFLAQYYLKNQQPEKTIAELLPITKKPQYLSYPRFKHEIFVTIAQAYWQLGEMTLAQNYATKSINQEEQLDTSEPTVMAYYLLYQIAKSEGDDSLALHYHEKYIAADKAYLNEVTAKTTAYELAQQNVLQKEAELNMLNKENLLLKAEQRIAQTEAFNTKLLIAILIAFILLLTYFIRKTFQKQVRLKELAEYDSLTGIYNRGHFNQAAQSALNFCENTEQALSIILFDLDDFKKVNDRFGHATGD